MCSDSAVAVLVLAFRGTASCRNMPFPPLPSPASGHGAVYKYSVRWALQASATICSLSSGIASNRLVPASTREETTCLTQRLFRTLLQSFKNEVAGLVLTACLKSSLLARLLLYRHLAREIVHDTEENLVTSFWATVQSLRLLREVPTHEHRLAPDEISSLSAPKGGVLTRTAEHAPRERMDAAKSVCTYPS